jgi:hypothetical protein
MITVACVYRSGGNYSPVYVEKLRRGFAENLKTKHRFVCLTDRIFASYCTPLVHPWPGWWAKMELFRPGFLKGPVLACDLDTVLMGDLSALINHQKPMVMMRDFNYSERANSCLMYWNSDLSFIYKAFLANPTQHMRHYHSLPFLGDQGMIEEQVLEKKIPLYLWQDILPKKFLINFQLEAQKGKSWKDSSLCWWTHLPKPHECEDFPLIKKYWV